MCSSPYYQANVPLASRSLPRQVYTGPKSKCRKFKGRLRLDADSGRRTHFLYGTREHQLNVSPIAIYPSLDKGLLYYYHPLNATLSVPGDIYKLEFLMQQLQRHMSVTPAESKIDIFSYTGEMTVLGQMTGMCVCKYMYSYI